MEERGGQSHTHMNTHTHTHTHARTRTKLLQHLIALIQDVMLDVLQVEGLVTAEGQDATGSPHHNVRAVALQHLLILLDADPTKEHGRLDVVEILTEPLVLLVDLERQLSAASEGGRERQVLELSSQG